MVSKDELMHAINYAFQSPFVRKIVGVTVPEDQKRVDDETAEKIKASAHMMGSIKSEHEKVREVICQAIQENPSEYFQAVPEYFNNQLADCQKAVDDAQQELDDCPKVDDLYVEYCQNKKQQLLDEMETKKKAIKENCYQEWKQWYRQDTLASRVMIIISTIALIIVVCLTKSGIMEDGIGILVGGIPVLCISIAGIMWLITRHDYGSEADAKEEIFNGTDRDVKKRLCEMSETYNAKIKQNEEGIQRGYEAGSDVEKKIHLAEIKLMGCQIAQAEVTANISYFADKLKNDPLHDFPDLLKKATDNMDSLSNWAAEYIREQRLEQHYAEVESIEEEKLQAQKASQRSQQEALRAQTALLQQQVDAEKARAEAAKKQAEAAQKQANDTAEIRRRLENERYGEIQKNPWEV